MLQSRIQAPLRLLKPLTWGREPTLFDLMVSDLSAERRSQLAPLPHLLLVIAVLSWAGNFIVGRFIHEQVPPVTLAFWHWLISLALLLPFAVPVVRAQWETVIRHWKLLVILGAAGVTAFHVFVYLALQSTQAINASMFLSTTPVVIVLLSWVMFRERVTLGQSIGIAVSFLGVLTIISGGKPDFLLELKLNRGDLWMLGAPRAGRFTQYWSNATP